MEIKPEHSKENSHEIVKHPYHEASELLGASESSVPTLKVDLSIPWKKPEFYSDGNGIKLKYIQTVATNIEVASDTFIEIMHYLLYLHIDEKSKMRRNILEFNGLKCNPGSINYEYRVRILSVFSMKQLTLICRVLCLPVWQYSRPFLSDGIMEFLAVPRVSAMKISALPISSDEYTLSAGDATMNQILLPEVKSFGSEESEILPDTPVTAEVLSVCKEAVTSVDGSKLKSGETEEIEIVPDILMSEERKQESQTQYIADHNGNQVFPKMVSLPNDISSDDYSEQVDMAYMKYVKSYLGYRLQPTKSPARTRHQETEEQAASRRALNALRMRQYRQNLRERETEEEAAARRARNALRVRNYRKFKRELEPELAAERRAVNAMRMRNYRKAKQEINPEIAAERRAKNALRMRNYRQNKRQQYRIVESQTSDSNYSANEELS